MKTKLPQDMTMSELDDLMFLVIKANYHQMKDEGVQHILDMFYAGFEGVEQDLDYWEV
jgi:hypothetical protein